MSTNLNGIYNQCSWIELHNEVQCAEKKWGVYKNLSCTDLIVFDSTLRF